MMRIAILYDNRPRPETTGLYCQRALEELVNTGRLVQVQHILPGELGRRSVEAFDLLLFIDDGLLVSIPETTVPVAYWAIDTHLDYQRELSLARQADWVFAAQRPGWKRLQEDGIQRAVWLPLACDPELHGRQPCPIQYDVGFVGNTVSRERGRLLEWLQQRYPRSFVGKRYGREMAEVYSASRIAFNCSVADDLNMRVFEALCSGSLLLTDRLSDEAGLQELMQEDEHCVCYEGDEELEEQLEYFLAHEDERREIAAKGRQLALKQHTYRHRMESLLDFIEQHPREERTDATLANEASSRSQRQGKGQAYFEHVRSDVLELIPQEVRSILDIGCGSGRLGEAIKQRQAAAVTGVELDSHAASQARQRLDEVVVGNVESGDVEFKANQFDCIVCADVLEHLREPEAVLAHCHRWLKPGGYLVTSLPNHRNHTVIRSLLAGNWTYESAGLLDNDHVRFFTRREIEKLLFRSGFAIDEMRMTGGEGFAEWVDQGRPQQLVIGGLQINAGSVAEASEFYAYQYLTRSRAAPKTDDGLTSIVIVTYNQLPYTQQCLDSIRLRTDEPYELVFVDNGSTDATVAYLQSLEDVTVIANEENRGFPAAVNQGIEAARGSQVLLLNNDTVVTTGWLRRMLDALKNEPNVGLVGPVSNQISGPQQVEVTYQHLNEMDGFAWDWGRQNYGRIVDVDRLVGFCLLIQRDVIEQIGTMDERFGIGNFEDDDFCRRARAAGYRSRIAVDSFVHHYGSVSFKDAGIDYGQLLRENQNRYREKWGPSHRSASSSPPTASTDSLVPLRGKERPEFVIESTPEGLKLQPNQIRLSACLIVRDNEATIGPCLESLRPWVDEIVVVDTGSQDRTPEICREWGARVFYWAWRDDFAAARNESVDHARGEWIFWMDSDDTLPETCGEQLRALIDGDHEEATLGYIAQVHCPGIDPTEITAVDHVKLFRNRPDLRFEFRIHEQIIPSIRRAGGEVAWTDLYVVHSGSDQTTAGRARKRERDLRLLEKELVDRPDHPFVLFNLGMTYADAEDYESAARYLMRCVQVTHPDESHLAKAYALLVNALSQIGQTEQAWETVADALRLFPDDKELLFRAALLQHQRQDYQGAEANYLRVLNEQTDRRFASIDQGIFGYKARHNLAIVYEESGQLAKAEEQWKQITAEAPQYLPGWRGRADNLVSQEKRRELEELLSSDGLPEALRLLKSYFWGRLAMKAGDVQHAKELWEAALIERPDDVPTLNELARWHFEQGDLQEAEPHLRNLLELTPQDAAIHTNLGMIQMSKKQYNNARDSFAHALSLRPDHTLALRYLEDCQQFLQSR